MIRKTVALALAGLVGLAMIAPGVSGGGELEKNLARQMLQALGENAGLCVHLGLQSEALAVELAGDGKYLVHGLTTRRETVERMRESIRSHGLAGAVSVEHHQLDPLPYSDNLVDLVVAESHVLADRLSVDQILRVLRPGGVGYLGERPSARPTLTQQQLADLLVKAGIREYDVIGEFGVWVRFRKLRPAEMDQWTHRRYDASRNAVSRDKVGVPSGVRWVAGPNWPTGNRKASVPGVVATKDRLVYVFDDIVQADEGPKRQKTLVARDAYNGLQLWKRHTSNADSPCLVHVGDRVYNVVEDGGPLVALDATSGDVVQTYREAGSPEDVVLHEGSLIVRTRSDLRCVDAQSGRLQWQSDTRPDNFVAADGRVFLQVAGRGPAGERVYEFLCLDAATGQEQWRASTESWPNKPNGLELVLHQAGILVLGGSGTHAISANDGAHLWSYQYKLIGHGGSYSKVVHTGGLVWVHNAASSGPDGQFSHAWEGLDPLSGEVKKRLAHGVIKHRCMYDAATERYFLCGSMDFVDQATEGHTRFTAARNSCRTAGVVPANGLVYTFPHGCACYPLLRGFLGLESPVEAAPAAEPASTARLETGVSIADSAIPNPQSAIPNPQSAIPNPQSAIPNPQSIWPTYRGDARRSGATTAAGPAQLNEIWQRELAGSSEVPLRVEWDEKDGGRLTGSVIADGLVFVASSDTHQLLALEAESGQARWSFTAGGRIDCPPTIHQGLCLFGSRDGWVYCLRAQDGELVWRYRAALSDKRIVAYGQLESSWPVVGGVLVHDGLAYFAAGRHAGADGGVHVYAAQPATGQIVWHSHPQDYRTLPDVLVGGDGVVYMADWQFDAKSGEDCDSTSREYLRAARLGLLNDAWYKRPLALRKNLQQWSAGQASGQLLVFDKDWVCGFKGASQVDGGDGRISGTAELFAKPPGGGAEGWSQEMAIGTQVQGMVLAGQTLYIAGRLDGYDPQSVAVRALSVADGAKLAEQPVPGPLVHECLSVAGERIYVSTQSGKLVCLGAK